MSRDDSTSTPVGTLESQGCYELRPDCAVGEQGVCEDCRLYAVAVEPAPDDVPSMPSGLAGRLRGLARPESPRPSDEDLDRVVAQALRLAEGSREPEGTEDPVLDQARDLLAETLREARRPAAMPESLRARLRGIVPDPDGLRDEAPVVAAVDLPVWIADSRWATAACALLTAALTLSAGDASARFVDLQESPSPWTPSRWVPWFNADLFNADLLDADWFDVDGAVDQVRRTGAKGFAAAESWIDGQRRDWLAFGDGLLQDAREQLPRPKAAGFGDMRRQADQTWNSWSVGAEQRLQTAADGLRRFAPAESSAESAAAEPADGTSWWQTAEETARHRFDDVAQWARDTFTPDDEPEENPTERKTP